MACSSSSNPREEYQYPYPYPYPTHVCAPNFVTVKLSGREMYGVWKTQMLCLLESHDMLGFINGTLIIRNSGLGKEKVSDYMLWKRSDALVKGWILGSLSEQTLRYVVNLVKKNDDFTANDVWDKLQTIYGPPPLIQQAVDDDEVEERKTRQTESISEDANPNNEASKEESEGKKRKEADERAMVHQSLYEATLSQKIEVVAQILRDGKVRVTDKITINGNTALHVAVGTTKNRKLLSRMLERIDESTLLDMRNADGSTLLHVAAIVGNLDAAEMLVEKNQDLLFAKDREGQTPLARALSNMHTDTYLYLLNTTKTRDIEMDTLFAGTSGEELLVNAISSKDYHSASVLSKHYRNFHSDAALMAIAQNFPHKLNIWENTFYKLVRDSEGIRALTVIILLSTISMVLLSRVLASLIKPKRSYIFSAIILLLLGPIFILSFYAFNAIYVLLQHIFQIIRKMNQNLPFCKAISGIYKPLQNIIRILPLQFKFVKEGAQMHRDATYLLKSICELIKRSVDSTSHHYYYNNAILEATRTNAYEVVVMIVSFFPNAIWSVNEDGLNIIQYAEINRSEKVYNLLYQMSEHKNIYRTIKDPFGNNLLHLAARLAPPNKLNPISGAALQIQRELQWYKEVEGFVCPLNIIQKNSFEETPEMVFTREHKELVIEGEKWMKATAESYTITAALISTIVFAAAITVPGGTNQETGIPIFSQKNAFTIFAVSDAISLFTSVTSLLMFLSILTTRFAEQDFLFKLPTKLIIGLTTLFISTTAMIVAFGATLLLVFGQRESWILIPIAALTCLPITSFVTLQFPLIADLTSATYGRSIFGKKRDHPFY